jgi:hypothetical protein
MKQINVTKLCDYINKIKSLNKRDVHIIPISYIHEYIYVYVMEN